MTRIFPVVIAAIFTARCLATSGGPTVIPQQEASLAFAISGWSALEENGREISKQSVHTAAASWLRRAPLPKAGWYYGWGIRADQITFANDGDFSLHRIQDCAAQLSLEYFVGTEAVVGITVAPGLYFENHPTSGAWDVPVEFECGVPLNGEWSGVVGFYTARFYRRPVPVIGVVWIATSHARVEAVFPNPALVVKLDSRTEARLGGELEGTGFLSDAHPARHKIEYSAYNVMGKVTREISPGLHVTLGVGRQFERLFDYLHESRRIRSRDGPHFQLGAEFAR